MVFSESGNRPATSYRGSGRPSVIMTEVLVVVSTATLDSGGVSTYVSVGPAGLSPGVVPWPPIDPPWLPNRIEYMVTIISVRMMLSAKEIEKYGIS